jgi:hypothetical protein
MWTALAISPSSSMFKKLIPTSCKHVATEEEEQMEGRH